MSEPEKDLEGRYVLLQVVPYFGYDQVIANALRARGATVDVLADRPFRSAIMHGVAKVARPALLRHVTTLYRAALNGWGRAHYDYILVINGQTMGEPFLRELRGRYPRAKLIYYIWDSFENKPYAVRALGAYDACFSFDPRGASRYGLGLRPLFYAPEFDLPAQENYDYHISFIGSAHSDRPAVLGRLDAGLPPDIRRYWFLYLKAEWVLRYRQLTNRHFRNVDRRLFSAQAMPRGDVRRIFAQSASFLDIEHDRQCGLTIRTFEALGTRRKLVTTNADIASYDFFDPANVRVIDRANPSVAREFFDEPVRELDPSLRRKYSVFGWIDEVLGLN